MSTTQINGATQIRNGTITNAQIDAAAAILTSKLADSANFIFRTGVTAFTADQSFGGQKATNLATPTATGDAATKGYVDAAVNGLDWKASVRVATTVAGTLSSSFANGATIDGVTLVTGDRILIKNQATGSENGIYTVNVSGAPTRATDADANAEVTAGMATFVSEGTTNGNTQWSLTTDDPITIGTTALVFSQIGGSTTYTGSNGIQIVGTVISPVYGSSSGTVCQGNDSRLSDSRTPTLHASTHQHGGSDEVATATAGANAIPKALGTGKIDIGWIGTGTTGTTVCIGNDSRLSDSRAPMGAAGGDLGGTYPNPTNTQSSVAYAFNGVLTPPQITADQNNYNPTNLATANTLRLDTDATRTITGLAGGASGRVILVHNKGSFNVVFSDEDTNSTAGNRFALNGSLTLVPDDCCVLQYDNTSLRWRCVAASRFPFGVGANTVCQGNDSRLSDARTPIGTALTSAQILVGNATNQVAAVAMSGDATITNAGVITVNAGTFLKYANVITRETPSGSINGSNVTFTLANTPISGSEMVFLNGILQDPGAGNDYTISGATITMLTAPVSGDKMRVTYMK